MGDFRVLGRIVLSMSIVILLLCLISLSAVKPGTGQYVVVVLSVWINVCLSGSIILWSWWRRLREARRQRLEKLEGGEQE